MPYSYEFLFIHSICACRRPKGWKSIERTCRPTCKNGKIYHMFGSGWGAILGNVFSLVEYREWHLHALLGWESVLTSRKLVGMSTNQWTAPHKKAPIHGIYLGVLSFEVSNIIACRERAQTAPIPILSECHIPSNLGRCPGHAYTGRRLLSFLLRAQAHSCSVPKRNSRHK